MCQVFLLQNVTVITNCVITLLLVKRQEIDKVSKTFNGFEQNLKFSVDKFENETPYFLNLEICPSGLTFSEKTSTLDSTVTWTSLLCGNGKRPGSCHLLIEQRTYAQRETFERNSNLLNKCFKELGRSTYGKTNFFCQYSVSKISFFTNMKDQLNKLSKSNVVYQFAYPCCESCVI